MKPFSRNNWGTPGVPMLYQPERLDTLYSDELAAKLCREYTQECVQSLVDHMRNKRSPVTSLAATNALLDRGFGKPKEIKTLTGPDGKSPRLRVEVEFIDTVEHRPRRGADVVLDQPPVPVFED